ncbi:ribosomal L7Ae/L30e/S12e/Gadd45 family protein [Candidatus Woesearchaeota archaeon]|nr:ribosomal L7Ae/L30e/S12e/Gadd45 family protein [Candidatus Woesearchaeota archaeon]
MTNIDEIKKDLKEDRLVIGTNKAVKSLRLGKLRKVYLTSNCPDDVKESVEKYSKLAKVEVVRLKLANDALGTVCKKPFSISVLGLKK